ncbi:MAG: TetR/AcrR family transcriptional regulator [bacterium]|nr:TetR/AcrR family transcriptional regulator [bacterium]MDT8396470.1 TetR/AcrR family transcriptional regulator [bacterium]
MHQKRDETRAKLLEATYRLISEKGYMGATTREIAAMAGVSELTLFRKFGRKELLFEEMLKTYTFLPRIRHLIGDVIEMPLAEGLKTIGVKLLETLRERRPLLQILFSEMTHYPEKVRSIYQQMIVDIGEVLKSYLDERKDRGEVLPIDMDFAARCFLRALVMTFMYESIIMKREISDEKIGHTVTSLVEIFLHGIARKGK